MATVPGAPVSYTKLIDDIQSEEKAAAPPPQNEPYFIEPGQPQARGNPYLDILNRDDERRSIEANAKATQIADKDPDAYARNVAISRDSGLPVGVVEIDPAAIELDLRRTRIAKAIERSPLLQAWAAQDENAILAMDDFENLSAMEQTFRSVKDVGMSVVRGADQGLGMGLQGAGNLFDAAARSVQRGARSISPELGALTELGSDAPYWTNPANWVKQAGKLATEAAGPDLPADRQTFATDVGAGLGQLITQAVTSAINPVAGMAIMSGQGAQQQVERAEEAGASQEQADRAAVLGATITGAVEKLGLDLLLDRLPPNVKNRAVRWIVDKTLAGGIEGGQEAIEQVGNNILARSIYEPDAPIFEGVEESAGVGGAVGFVARSLLGIRDLGGERRRVKSEQTTLDTLVKAAGKSTLNARMPDKFADAIDTLAENGASHVYVPAEAVQKLYQSVPVEQAAADLGVSVADYSEALLTDGDIAIPMGPYLSRVAPQHHEALKDVARFTPGSMTVEESAEMEAAASEAATKFRETVGADQAAASDQRVYDDVYSQIMATGRYRPEDAEKYAQILQAGFRTLAARTGRDAMALYEPYALRIKSELPRVVNALGETVLDQAVGGPKYPLAEAGTRYEETGDKPVVSMTPDEYLAAVRPLDVDEASRDAIDDLKRHIEAGGKLDPLHIRADGKEDGRHRAMAAKELGIERVPVVDERPRDPDAEPQQIFEQAAYHGTPHTIGPEGFSLDKVGTGEGAQVYGWGLYFAESRGVAESYKRQLSETVEVPDGTPPLEKRVAQMAVNFGGDTPNKWLEKHKDGATHLTPALTPELVAAVQAKFDSGEFAPGGNLYQVEIPDDAVANFLDWDAPLSEQPQAVQDAVDGMAFETDGGHPILDPDGSEIYRSLSEQKGGDQAASDYLKSIGVPGLRYLDGQSRDAGQGTRNLVVFDDSLIKITHKDGSPVSQEERDTVFYQGKPQTETPAFKKWFGDSKVVDANGNPLVVYHGTSKGGFDQFKIPAFFTSSSADAEFYHHGEAEAQTYPAYLAIKNPLDADGKEGSLKLLRIAEAAGVETNFKDGEYGWSFDAPEIAENSPYDGASNNVYDLLYIPRVRDAVLAAGYDGVIGSDVMGNYEIPVYIALKSEQIKSAIGNSGAFDPSNPSILAQSPDQANQPGNKDAIARGFIAFNKDRKFSISLLEKADATTFLHETGHFFLEVMGDIATSENAPQEIKDEYAAALKWLGVDSREQIGTEQHEKFARGFEAYLGSGQAPTAELAAVFARFKAWVKAIYRSLKNLNVELTDDARQMFDRLLATDEEITQAQNQVDVSGLFADARAAGWSDAQFAARLKLDAEAREEAEASLMARAMRDVKRETRAWWKEREAEVRETVQAELQNTPVYRAWSFLKSGTLPDGTPVEGAAKLDKGWLLTQYGQEFLNKHLRRKQVYSVSGGADPDLVALQFGFESGDAMVQALANAQPIDQVIRAETRARMIQQYGDVMTDGSMPEAAMQAVHSSKRFKAMEADLKALEKLAGEPRPSAAGLRRTAELIMGQKRVRDVKPHTYLRAERKAAKEAVAAMAKGDIAAALDAQRRRILNAHLYDESSKVEKETESLRRYIRRFEKTPLRAMLGKVDRLDEVDALLDRYDLKRVSGRKLDARKAQAELLAKIQSGEVIAPQGLVRTLMASERTNWADLTVEDLRGLRDVLRQAEAVARAESEAMVNGQKVEIQARADEIAEAVTAAGKDMVPTLAQESQSDKLNRFTAQLIAAWRRPSSMARILEGSDWGPITRNIIVPMRRAITEKLEPRLKQARDDIAAIWKSHYTEDEMKANAIRRLVPSLGGSYSKFDMLAIAQQYGNEGGRAALLKSQAPGGGMQPFTEAGLLAAFRETLDARDWDFVQASVDYMDTYWPESKEANRRRRGIAPPKVDALPFTVQTSDGQTLEIKGGYAPLSYRNDLSDRNTRADTVDVEADRLMSGKSVAASTKYSHNQARVGSAGSPISININNWMRHVEQVIRDLSIVDEAIYIDKLLKNPAVRASMIRTGNKETLEALDLWLKDTVVGDIPGSAADALLKVTRKNLTLARLGFNVKTMLLQVTGLPQTIAVVGQHSFTKGASKYLKGQKAAISEAMQKSAFMRTRYELDAWNRDAQVVKDAMSGREVAPSGNDWKASLAYYLNKLQLPPRAAEWAMAGIKFLQMQVDTVTWHAGYSKGVEQGMGDHEASLYADSIVENAQTSGMTSDRSGFERGTFSNNTRQQEFVRIWTWLGSYMLAKGNIAAESYIRNDLKTPRGAARFAADIALLGVTEALVGAMIFGGGPDEEDDESWAKWIFKQGATSLTAGIPFVREIAGALSGFGGGGPFGTSAKDIANLYKQAAQGEADIALVKAMLMAAGDLTGIPSVQINRAVSAAAREMQGEDVPAYEYVLPERK